MKKSRVFRVTMRIVEIKAQSVKIIFKPTQNQLKIGDFVSFTEGDLTLIAQVFRIVSSAVADDFNQADLYFVLSHQYEKIKPWSGEILSAEAQVEKTPKNFLEKFMNLTNAETKVALGEYLEYTNEALILDAKKFSTPTFIGYEKFSDCENLINCIQNSFFNTEKKLVLIDFYGNMNFQHATKLKAGYQVKLPLNSKLLDNLCAKILEGVSIESKAVIEDILLELAQYANQNSSGFIPISQLIKVIDDIYQKSKISQLILLKNRLRKYQKLGIFADNSNEVYAIFNELELNSSVIFDLADTPIEWRKDFVNNLLDLNNKIQKDFYIFYNLDEQNSDNSMINTLLFKTTHTGIKPILASNYRYLSLENIYDFSQNIFLFKTYNALKKRANISDILQSLPQNSFMLSGSLTNGLIICAKTTENSSSITLKNDDFEKENTFNETYKDKNTTTKNPQYTFSAVETPIKKIDMELMNTAFKPEPSINIQTPDKNDFSIRENFADIPHVENTQNIPDFNESELIQEHPTPENTNDISDEIKEEISIEPVFDEIQENQNIEPEQNINEMLEPSRNIFDEDDDDINFEEIEEINQQNPEATYAQQEISEIENPIEDLDLDDLDFLNETDESPYEKNEQQNDDDLLDLLEDDDILLEKEASPDISEVDFDEIDDLVSNNHTEKSLNQKLPVYSADYQTNNPAQKNTQIFQEGDLVKHSKYGIGTVKKLTSHGDKMLCHINFEDFGRRLLDPDISQLEKIQ